VLTFGLSDDCDVRATYTQNSFGSDLAVITSFPRRRDPSLANANLGSRLRGNDGFTIKLAAAGVHNVRNALAAIACALAAGIPVDAIVRGLEAFAPVSGRLQRKQAAERRHRDRRQLQRQPRLRARRHRRAGAGPSPRILVLGDMGEVGTQGPEFHQEIGAMPQAAASTPCSPPANWRATWWDRERNTTSSSTNYWQHWIQHWAANLTQLCW
jgi:UDP-N-acetylmuramoyl-tripeptide--D-alanyl-D-alanine ligase